MPVIVQETSQPSRGQAFRGMNVNLPPERLPPSDFQYADNMWVIAGELWTRPGRRGMFSLALPDPIYCLKSYAAASSGTPPSITTWLMFVSGSKLYIAQAGQSDPPTEVKIGGTSGTSFSLNGPTVRMQRVGPYMYIVDGIGPLYKVLIPYINSKTAYTAAAYVGLTAPTGALSASLTNQVIDTVSDVTKWSSFPALTWPNSTTVANAETISNTIFDQGASGGGASSQPPPTGWITGGDTMDFQASITGTGMECLFDAGAGPSWVDWDYPTPTYAAGTNTIGNARVFAAAANGHSSVGGKFGMQAFPESSTVVPVTPISYTDIVIVTSGTSSTISSAAHPFQSAMRGQVITSFGGTGFNLGNFTITAVNAGTHVATVNGNIGTAASTGGIGTLNFDSGYGGGSNIWGNRNTVLQVPPSAIAGADQSSDVFTCSGANTKFEKTFSFSALAQDFDYIKYRLIGPASNTASGVNTPSFKVVDVRLILETSSQGTIHLKANNPLGVGYNCLGGVWVKRNYTGDVGGYRDFSQSNTISIKYTAPSTTPQIPFRIGFLKAGMAMGTNGANIVWTNVVTYTSDGSAFFCDCSTVDAAIRAQTAYLFLKIDSDLPTTINPADLCTLGAISTSGNLTLHELYGGWGGDYTYQITKINASHDSVNFIDVVESDPSPMSVPPAQPNGVSNQVGLPLPVDPGDGTTHWGVYRLGGVFADGLGRLIARLPIASDQAADAQHQYTWNHTTRLFVDNTTDSSLEVNTPTFLLSGRTPLPNGATCITEWQGHMCAAHGSVVQIGWAIPSGNNSALYFNTVNVSDPNDIAQSVKGAYFNTGDADNDPVQNLIPLGPYLIVETQRSTLLITGVDAGSFAMSGQYVRAGLGLSAPLAYAVIGGGLRYLGPDAMYIYNGADDPVSMSEDIEPLLNPGTRGLPPLRPSAYSQAFCIWKGRRLYLCAPGSPESTGNDTMYVWDSRSSGAGTAGGWVRWTGTLDNRVFDFTSATTLEQSDDLDNMYFASMDGQIYSMSQLGGDTHLAGDTPQPIPIRFVGRAEGQSGASTFGAEVMSPFYFNTQRPEWLQLNVVTTENVTLNLSVKAAACDVAWSCAYQTNGQQLCVRKEVASQVEGLNVWPELTAQSVEPIIIKRLALELSVGSPGENA